MSRNYSIDFFRGFFLIIITIDHFFSDDNIIKFFTHEFVGWVSAAEGFVFLSGLTAGLIYTYKINKKEPFDIAKAARKRAWTIYKYHFVLLLLTLVILASHFYIKEFWTVRFEFLLNNPLVAILTGSIFRYQPIYLDILPMYTIYILLVPVVIKSFQANKYGLILSLSGILYAIGTCDIQLPFFSRLFPTPDYDTGSFDLLCWQLLFIGGLFFGFLMYHGKTNSLLNSKILLFLAVICSLALFITKLVYAQLESQTLLTWLGKYAWISKFSLVDKENLRPFRLLNFASLTFVVAFMASHYKKGLNFKPFCYLGKYSLEVFSFHILLIIVFKPFKEYSNQYYALPVTDSLYFYPWATCMLFFILLPALFLAPLIKNNINAIKLKSKPTTS